MADAGLMAEAVVGLVAEGRFAFEESSLGGGGGGTGVNDSSKTQFPLFPESLITLELESLYFAIDSDCDEQPMLMLPPRIEHLRITSEDANRDYVTFDGSLGPLPPSLRTLFVDHYEAAELPPLPPGLRELTLGEYDHALQAPLPPCLEALELRDWCTPQRVCDALATAIGGNLQRLTLAGPIPGGSLRLAIGPLPTTLTHFTCWLWGHKNEEGSSSDAQLPPLPQGLQELRVNGV
ncbi:hypothetical protein JKP88DRAFT_351062 [Tribonema minus]|uniref:Uncharacterized protein n=1 Tax=Tribonema minus TaxID=303371 RepID=A0A835YU92_9STRA|nr:hypothetical protein JKP88DRAFT_351062 [Tribonema minus]